MADIITTTAGPVEVEVSGSGVPILVVHGSPGGLDGSKAMSRFLPRNNFKVICFSRPGYCGTPLAAKDPSIDCEADLMAALLDAIQIERVGVLAWSGGGPSAYRFAVRHPQRVSALVAIAACSSKWVAPIPTFSERIMFGTTFGQHVIAYLAKKQPRHIVEEALKHEGTLRGPELTALVEDVMADLEQQKLIIDTVLTLNTGGKRKAGWLNDVSNFANIKTLQLEQIQCPVLLIHGDGDTDAIVDYSRKAHEAIPTSSLIELEKGTHLAFYAHPRAAEVQEKARVLFAENAPSKKE